MKLPIYTLANWLLMLEVFPHSKMSETEAIFWIDEDLHQAELKKLSKINFYLYQYLFQFLDESTLTLKFCPRKPIRKYIGGSTWTS